MFSLHREFSCSLNTQFRKEEEKPRSRFVRDITESYLNSFQFFRKKVSYNSLEKIRDTPVKELSLYSARARAFSRYFNYSLKAHFNENLFNT